ncbi:MAG: hypothetical protein ABJB40_02180 [Acidobacteriota bacterium]
MLDRKINILVILLVFTMTVIGLAFTGAAGANSIHISAVPVATPDDKPLYSGYKGVTIGMKQDEARTKLGMPKDKTDEQESYVFSDNESAQVYYDAGKVVTAIMITYNGKLDTAPNAKAVFGEDAQAKPDGGIFKMVRYPKAGFWISYNKTAGDDPLIIIAIQKM